MLYTTEPLNDSHHRNDFLCGKGLLDNYIKLQAGQDIKRKLSVCFVLICREDGLDKVKGYYTLSNKGIPRDMVPEVYQKKFPKTYHSIPTTLIGRLARDQHFKGDRVGEFLLLDALYKCCIASKTVASFAVVVDPIDDEAVSFYQKYGFQRLPDSGRMFLPMKTVEQLF